MESLKPISEICQPDPRNLMFVRLDTGEPLTVEEHHARVASAVLHRNVPEDVRSYFTTIQNLCIYAWFAYDLYPVVQFLCCAAIEMALRMKFPVQGRDKRGLKALLREAVGKNLIKAKGFSHMRNLRQTQAERLRADRHIFKLAGPPFAKAGSPIPKTDYGEILAQAVPFLRNAFAHPRKHAIIMPGEALMQLHITSEFINQLFV